MLRIRFRLWQLFLLTTLIAVAVAIYALSTRERFPYASVEEAAQVNSWRRVLVEKVGDQEGPYRATGAFSFNPGTGGWLRYTIDGVRKRHKIPPPKRSNRWIVVELFVNPKGNSLAFVYVHDTDLRPIP